MCARRVLSAPSGPPATRRHGLQFLRPAIPYSLFPIPYSLFPIPSSLFPVSRPLPHPLQPDVPAHRVDAQPVPAPPDGAVGLAADVDAEAAFLVLFLPAPPQVEVGLDLAGQGVRAHLGAH